jgi:hypothetical protein
VRRSLYLSLEVYSYPVFLPYYHGCDSSLNTGRAGGSALCRMMCGPVCD